MTAADDGWHVAVRVDPRRFAAPVAVRIRPTGDAGAAWRVTGADATLAPGAAETLRLAVTTAPGQARYPLPRLHYVLTTRDGDGAPLHSSGYLSVPLPAPPTLAIATAEAAPAVDGSLQDPIWQRLPDVSRFGQMDRARWTGTATRAWLAADADALYVAVRCDEPRMADRRITVRERDGQVYRDDSVEVLLDVDPSDDRYHQIVVNAAGTVYDGRNFDASVDIEGLTVASARAVGGWVVELRIPWRGVDAGSRPEHPTLLLGRTRFAGGETEVSQFPVSPRGNHAPERFAAIRFTAAAE